QSRAAPRLRPRDERVRPHRRRPTRRQGDRHLCRLPRIGQVAGLRRRDPLHRPARMGELRGRSNRRPDLRRGMTMPDIAHTLVSNSTQLDNVDLMGGARDFTITGVTLTGSDDQPLSITLAEYDRPWKPGLTMRRLLAH